tara:strand:- start:2162 stop:2338 length:177 start_codon:yes stop_codon:yes gene_type:complete
MIVERLKKIIEILCEAEEDSRKCEEGNASAGRRVRKISMEAIKELKDLRSMILEHSKK